MPGLVFAPKTTLKIFILSLKCLPVTETFIQRPQMLTWQKSQPWTWPAPPFPAAHPHPCLLPPPTFSFRFLAIPVSGPFRVTLAVLLQFCLLCRGLRSPVAGDSFSADTSCPPGSLTGPHLLTLVYLPLGDTQKQTTGEEQGWWICSPNTHWVPTRYSTDGSTLLGRPCFCQAIL